MASPSKVKDKRLYMPEDGLILSETAVLTGLLICYIYYMIIST